MRHVDQRGPVVHLRELEELSRAVVPQVAGDVDVSVAAGDHLAGEVVDGAGGWSKFRNVTLPGIRPVTTFLIITGTIGSFQLFELPYVIFLQEGGAAGPKWAGLTVVMYLYQQGFEVGDLGAACAVG